MSSFCGRDCGESRSLVPYWVETRHIGNLDLPLYGKRIQEMVRSTLFFIEREAHSSRGLAESWYANNSTNGLTAMLSEKEFPIPSPW